MAEPCLDIRPKSCGAMLSAENEKYQPMIEEKSTADDSVVSPRGEEIECHLNEEKPVEESRIG